MRSRHTFILATALLLGATAAWPATFIKAERYAKDFQIDPDGVLVIENPIGNIEIIGADASAITLAAEIAVQGADDAAFKEGRDETQIQTAVSEQMLVVKTVTPLVHSSRWASSVNYVVRVPRGVQVKVVSQWSKGIHVTGTNAAISIKNFDGQVTLDNVDGPVVVDSVNGNIFYESNGRPNANLQLQTVNGEIRLTVAPDAAFRWNAQTISGEFRSNMPVRGSYAGTNFRGYVNSPRGPIVTTAAMMGSVYVLKRGAPIAQAQSVRTLIVPQGSVNSIGPVVPRTVRKPYVDGNFDFGDPTVIGDVQIGQVRGNAKVVLRAGAAQLGMVMGDANVISQGGPLTFGDVFGPLSARTGAGDIVVNAARSGGSLWTDGGMIRVVYSGAAITLHSGGGDVSVRSAIGPVNAETRSGDVIISVDPGVRTDTITAKTQQGNVVLNVTPHFAADIDATIMTSSDDSNTIRCDFNGLSIRREPVGSGRMRIRATGKVNGGGDRVEIFAADGDIQITGEVRQPLLSPVQP